MEQFLPIVVGIIVSWVIQHIKRYGITSKQSIVGIAVLCSVAYYAFDTYTPKGIKDSLYGVFAQIMTTAFLIYEFIIKNSKKSVKSATKPQELE